MTEPNKPLTEKTLERLRALAKGNGLAAERITVLESNETVQAARGLLTIKPLLDIQVRSLPGRVNSQGPSRPFPSFEALEQELTDLRKSFSEGTEWLDQARAEIEKTASKGWGEDGSEVTWDAQASVLVATENCPVCRGSGTRSCPACQGLGFTTCPYCEGRGKELCPHCAGRGEDPAQPGTPCSVCHGERYAECRYCHLSGKLPCEECHGKTTLPCDACKGTGSLSREARVEKKAVLHFALGETRELPSGFLRMMQRIGLDKMPALGTIESAHPADDPKSDAPENLLSLTAHLPYAEIKMKIGSRQGRIIAFGKTGRLSGVPAFLDDVLTDARKLLGKAAKGELVLEKVLGLRVMKDALRLSLAGKTHPNELRRIYPVGLTGAVAAEIMKMMGLALRAQTKATRTLIGWSYTGLCGCLFAGLMFTPLLDDLAAGRGLVAALSVQLLILAAAMAGGWLVMSNAARWALRQKYPQAVIGARQKTGKTGFYVLGSIFALYFVLLVLSGHGPL